jgi:hypothetical protein
MTERFDWRSLRETVVRSRKLDKTWRTPLPAEVSDTTQVSHLQSQDTKGSRGPGYLLASSGLRKRDGCVVGFDAWRRDAHTGVLSLH